MPRIPDFETLDEAVEFWETHDSADYLDDTEEVLIEVDLRQNLFHPKSLVLASRPEHCPRCRSELDETTIQYAAGSNGNLLIIRDVPALVCRANGHEYLLEDVLDRIEQLLQLEKTRQIKPTETIQVPVFSLTTPV